jgi:PKD repeat protein
LSGGTPTVASTQTPTIQYNTEGVFPVTLTVTNDFGTDVLTKNDYIVVTSTPKPWISFSSDASYACIDDTVHFMDESLYDPTEWTWEFSPNSVSFINGTDASSQDPTVVFTDPGYYTVTLTASNAFGSNTSTIDNMVQVEGIKVNFSEDFEGGTTTDLILTNGVRGMVGVDKRSAAPGSIYGMHFQGGTITGGWSGGPVNTTPEQAWNENTDFQAQAGNCSVDATDITGVGLTFDLRQTFSIGYTYSWFRVLINGEQVADINGNSNFNPATNTDPFVNRVFDLSAYGNSKFSITFQSSCYLSDKFFQEGDNAFVDNIEISNTTGINSVQNENAAVLTYPNPVKDILHYSPNGLGKEFTAKVIDTRGRTLYSGTVKNFNSGETRHIDLSNLSSGIYILQLSSPANVVTRKIVVE